MGRQIVERKPAPDRKGKGMDAFWIGFLAAHVGYGITFFVIGCKRSSAPSIAISAIAIMFWPVMVHHIMTRPTPPSRSGR